MPPTTRLHYEDPFLLEFDARIDAHADWKGAPSLVLDRTAFYAEAGGQLGDHGEIAGARVVDVQLDDDGVVHHVIEGERPSVGAAVHATIARPRRRLHMALHTAQHMLSRALVDEARADTVSARLGESDCTIDVDRAAIDERELARAESLVNAVIDDDLAIRAFFPSPDELAKLPLRRTPKVTENIRVVDIGGFDVTPCGGTHCVRSAQVGLVRVTGLERYKGKMRVHFTAGARARADLATDQSTLVAVSRELTCGPRDVLAAIDKLRRELTSARESLGQARERLAVHAADALLARGGSRVVEVFDGESVEFLREVGARITARPDAVALLGARTSEGVHVVFARGAQSTFDCGAALKKIAAACGGRGGGKPDRAEGRLPANADLAALVSSALAE